MGGSVVCCTNAKNDTHGIPSDSDFNVNSGALSSPYRNFTFSNYPILHNLHAKLSTCGSNFVTLLNTKTNETISIPLYCDNRVCLNPDCQTHRLYKYMKAHSSQISMLNKDMHKPKAWVFTDVKKPFPIDRCYVQKRLRLLHNLLSLNLHKKYGSTSMFSIHMEIKLNSDSWYLHFHVVSGGVTNLRFVHKLWGRVIRYETAISPMDLAFYVSKYASKVPSFPSKLAFLEYAFVVYKLQMHIFSCVVSPDCIVSDWVIVNRTSPVSTNAFFELDTWLDCYLDDFGFGG